MDRRDKRATRWSLVSLLLLRGAEAASRFSSRGGGGVEAFFFLNDAAPTAIYPWSLLSVLSIQYAESALRFSSRGGGRI